MSFVDILASFIAENALGFDESVLLKVVSSKKYSPLELVLIPNCERYIPSSPYPVRGARLSFLKLDFRAVTDGSIAKAPLLSPSTSIKVRRSISALNSFNDEMRLLTLVFTAFSERAVVIVAAEEKFDFSSTSTPSMRSSIVFFVRVTLTPSSLKFASDASWLKVLLLG